ncbi:MAG: sigma-70 family RNA polymerase sigma factor [Clostridia bacterium]|nr:sigma-70 family RNA polymerase sigma factor [Clostridia bacterium]
MEDNKIIELYWKRDQSAIDESNKKYGKYCRTIAYNILYSKEDSEECVNDTWHNAWRTIPPEKPSKLQYFLGRITRNLALDRYGYNKAQKRNSDLESAIEEYYECIPNGEFSVEDEVILKKLINEFLESLDSRARIIFLRRYWYALSVQEIAQKMGMSESHVSVILHRTRNRFKDYLKKEGITV